MVKCVVCGENTWKLSYFSFPVNQEIRNKWLEVCNLNENEITRSSKVCSKHFSCDDLNENDYLRGPGLKEKAVPQPFKQTTLKKETVLVTEDLESQNAEEILRQPEITQEPQAKIEYENYEDFINEVKNEIFEDPESSQMVTTECEISDNELESFDCLATKAQIPSKSFKVYEAALEKFLKWCQLRHIKQYTENVLLTYFIGLNMKSSSMWAQYSMLKTMLIIKNNLDISTYTKLRNYLRKQNEGYTPKKARIFTKEQLEKFICEAPDEKYLGIKIALIIGICGACRCDEMLKMKTTHIKDLGSLLYIQIPDSTTNATRTFTIADENYINIYRKYVALRPVNITDSRFFIKYTNGKCHRAVMGIHKIGSVPREVATYLKLPHSNEYTGHSLRRTSSTLPVAGGIDTTCLKRFGRKTFNATITIIPALTPIPIPTPTPTTEISIPKEVTDKLPDPQPSKTCTNNNSSAVSHQDKEEEEEEGEEEKVSFASFKDHTTYEISQLRVSDFSNPVKAKRNLHSIQRAFKLRNLKIRKLQEENKRMKRRLNLFKSLLKEKREKEDTKEV